MSLTVGSLFSGIGGLDLGLERAGMRVIWQSEIHPYASRVLAKHWPEVPNYGDITRVEWRDVVRPDIICGGYPCQPFSFAGYRRGEDDERHLWPFVREAISELRPRYAIMENVRGHLSLGFDRVLGDLSELGYRVEWHLVRASAIGASHRRERLLIVAYPDDSRGDNRLADRESSSAFRAGSQVFEPTTASDRAQVSRRSWVSVPDVGRVTDGVPSRVDRLRGLGNAVVPQVAELIGHLVIEHYQRTKESAR